MQRLALFDLDNTLVDLDEAFRAWAREFADERDLGPGAVDWLFALDKDGFPHREVFFTKVRGHFALPDSVDELWRRYRQRMPNLVHCRPEVLDGLCGLRASGWLVAIVTNGMADNQLGNPSRMIRKGLFHGRTAVPYSMDYDRLLQGSAAPCARVVRGAWHLPVWSGPNRVGGGPQKATTLRMTLRSGWRSRRRGCAASCATTAGRGLPRSW